MRDMFASDAGEEYVSGMQCCDPFLTVFAVVHVDTAIEHREYFFTVIHMPAIGSIRPVQARSDTVDVGDIERTPGALGDVLAATNDFHLARFRY